MSKYAEFHGHFVFGKTPPVQPEGWEKEAINGSTLTFHFSSEFIPVYYKKTRVGFVLGYILDIDEILEDRILILSSDEFSTFENALFSLAGRFVGYIKLQNQERFYQDPSGGMPAIYSKQLQLIASVPTLLFDDEIGNIPPPLFNELDLLRRYLWFPGQLTPFKNILRLLPNHFLELNTWETQRHWPTNENLNKSSSPKELVKDIGVKVAQIIHYAAKQNDLWLSLTAGRDSRMLLACARNHLDSIRFFTFSGKQETIDAYTARQISKELKLDWELLLTESATDEQLNNWLNKTGYALADSITKIHPTLRKLNHSGIIAPGMAGEVGRAFYWKRNDTMKTQLTPKSLLTRLQLPHHPAFINSVEHWLSSVKDFDTFTKLDLAYIELRLGCWGMPQTYGHLHLAQHLYPFSHRDVFLNMLNLPNGFRKKQLLFKELINQQWPKLLDYPINSYSGLRRIWGFYQKTTRIPAYLKKKYKL